QDGGDRLGVDLADVAVAPGAGQRLHRRHEPHGVALLRGALGQRGGDGGQGGGQLGQQRLLDEGGDVARVGRGGGGGGEGGGGRGLDGRPFGRRLDQRHFEGRVPPQRPRLLERAPGAAGIGRLAPVDPEDGQAAEERGA